MTVTAAGPGDSDRALQEIVEEVQETEAGQVVEELVHMIQDPRSVPFLSWRLAGGKYFHQSRRVERVRELFLVIPRLSNDAEVLTATMIRFVEQPRFRLDLGTGEGKTVR